MHYLWSAGRTPRSTGNIKLSLIYANRAPLLPTLDPALCHMHSHTHTRRRAHKCAHISTHRHWNTHRQARTCVPWAHACAYTNIHTSHCFPQSIIYPIHAPRKGPARPSQWHLPLCASVQKPASLPPSTMHPGKRGQSRSPRPTLLGVITQPNLHLRL